MENDNWVRQLTSLVVVAMAKAAVEFLTNPGARDEATNQLRTTFSEIDYDALAKALTRSIDDAAETGKDRLGEAIDTLRDRSVEAVDEAREKADKQFGRKRGGRKMRFLIGLMIGGLIAYFFLDEQRRDELLDRLTGASGPIQQSTYSATQQAASTTQQAASGASSTAHQAANTVSGAAQSAAGQAQSASQKAANATSEAAQSAAEKTDQAASKASTSAEKAKEKTEK